MESVVQPGSAFVTVCVSGTEKSVKLHAHAYSSDLIWCRRWYCRRFDAMLAKHLPPPQNPEPASISKHCTEELRQSEPDSLQYA